MLLLQCQHAEKKKVIDFALFKYSALLLIIVLCGYQQFFFTLCMTKKKKFLYTLYGKGKKHARREVHTQLCIDKIIK